ncbi:hypothetical protein F511_46973 [Dorcoceras hygrometricum]|uniref:Uncharacterized protein n=1 Tax=Dorcoceras hygrometricum TaxID=472368 RepID=A0A2Z6ZYX2_9LAMI|nr:hypothetical protein F511_46973 [Dorcoceras hygrometricum]
MDTFASAPDERPLLRRRNSTSNSDLVVPTKLSFLHHQSSSSTVTTTSSSSTSSFPSDDLELLPIKRSPHSYTSLKDLLPSAAVNSPKPSAVLLAHPGSDICIRNRLVKQAAWAYLQPMYTLPGPVGGSFFHRFWPRVSAVFDFICRNVRMAFDRALRSLRIRSSR